MLLGGAVVAAATAAAGCTYSFIYILAVGYRFLSPLNVCGYGVRVCDGLHVIWKSMGKRAAAAQAEAEAAKWALRCWFTIWDSPRCPAGLWSSSLWPFCSFGSLNYFLFCWVSVIRSVCLYPATNQPKENEWMEKVCCCCQRNVFHRCFSFFVSLFWC